METQTQPVTFPQRLRVLRNQLTADLFEQDGLNTIFQHARNVLFGTLVVACGVNATHHPEKLAAVAPWAVHQAGYVVMAVGFVLLLLNLWDGLRKLAGRQYPAVVRALAAVVYVALTVRLVQAIALFQGVL